MTVSCLAHSFGNLWPARAYRQNSPYDLNRRIFTSGLRQWSIMLYRLTRTGETVCTMLVEDSWSR
jgi:hypothetical protein